MNRIRAIKRFQQNARQKSQNGGQVMLTCSLTAFCDACFCPLGSFVIGNIQPSRWDVFLTDKDTTQDIVCPLAAINVRETQIKEAYFPSVVALPSV